MANLPDFPWARIYYPEILAALGRMKTRDWPEHTEEDPHDPVNQLLALYAFVGHLGAVRTDHVAREMYLPTLRLRSSLLALGRLVDYALATAVPAEVDLIADVSGSIGGAGATLVRPHSIFATIATADEQVLFEYAEADALTGSETGTWVGVLDDGGALAAMTFPQALGTPVAGDDAYYFGHPDLMFDRIGIEVTGGTAAITTARWEYYDADAVGQPRTAGLVGSGVRFTVRDVVGYGRADGLDVIVTCLTTGVQETAQVFWSGSENMVDTATALGQSVRSTNAGDYEVRTYWPELPGVADGTIVTGALEQTGTVSWTLPQTTTRRWIPTTVNGVEGYFVRARPIVVTGAAAGTLAEPTEPRQATWTCAFVGRQGQRVVDRVGTTDTGSASQAFTLQREPFLELVGVTVAGVEWVRVDNFLSSASYDRHYTLTEQIDGSWRILFGTGLTGKIPGASAAVEATYRIGGVEAGNVGAGTITRDRSGNTKLRNLRNPRAAEKWVAAEGSTPASMDLARVAMPASTRTGGRAVTASDCESIAVAFRTAAGFQPVVRALAVEEGLGPKTIELLCVGQGGAAPAQSDLDELAEHFNGTTVGLQRIGGVVMANTELTPSAYPEHEIDVTVTVDVLADYASGAQASIEAALSALLSAVALRQIRNAAGEWETSTTYLWTWGRDDGSVKVARGLLFAAIATAIDGVVNIAITTPAADVTLAAGELPTAGTIAVTVVSA